MPAPTIRRRDVQKRIAKGEVNLTPSQLKALSEVWEPLFHLGTTSIERFFTIFEIDTDVEDDEDDEANVVYAPFVLRRLQRRLLRYITRQRWKGRDGRKPGAARIMNLKGRRYGMTTFFLVFGLERILRIPGYNVVLIAQDDVMARVHFGRVRSFFRQIPTWALAALGITIVKDTDNEIRLRHGQYRESSFRVAPARRNALGRGDRVNMLILTEFPQWPPSAKEDLTGILRTCNRQRGNVTVFESTARGREEFHARCKRAWLGRSDYHFFFIPAYMHPGSHMEFRDDAEMDAFEATVGKTDDHGGDEELHLYRYLMSEASFTREKALTHLQHRRSVLMSEYGGHLPFYHREEPNTPREAFEGTGRPVFDLARLNGWADFAEEQEDKAKRGELRRKDGKVAFLLDQRVGRWTIFEEPIPGHVYCYGVDVASGQEKIADTRMEADWSVIVVKHALSGRTVARFRAHIAPGLLAEEILLASVWYHEAEGNVEVNNDGGITVDTLEDLEYAGLLGINIILSREVFEMTDSGKKASYRLGFKTTTRTKHALVRAIQDFIAEIGPASAEKPPPMDFLTLEEETKFSVPDQGGAGEASEGHDDLVIGEGLCLLARTRVVEDMPESSRVPAARLRDGTERHFLAVFESKKKQVDSVLGSAF